MAVENILYAMWTIDRQDEIFHTGVYAEVSLYK